MENDHKFFENRSCKYYPCHEGIEELNCLFCYCPLYNMADCPGRPEFNEKAGGYRKVCTGCTFPHNKDNYDKIVEILKQKGLFKEEPLCEA